MTLSDYWIIVEGGLALIASQLPPLSHYYNKFLPEALGRLRRFLSQTSFYAFISGNRSRTSLNEESSPSTGEVNFMRQENTNKLSHDVFPLTAEGSNLRTDVQASDDLCRVSD